MTGWHQIPDPVNLPQQDAAFPETRPSCLFDWHAFREGIHASEKFKV